MQDDAHRSPSVPRYAAPDEHHNPYVLLNYTGNLRDVMTLAHELGHGVHQCLAAGQGLLEQDTPLTTAETASVFGEMLVLALLRGYDEEDEAFVPRHLDILRAGGSDTPQALLARIGIDVSDPGFWDGGLAVLEDLVAETEALAR